MPIGIEMLLLLTPGTVVQPGWAKLVVLSRVYPVRDAGHNTMMLLSLLTALRNGIVRVGWLVNHDRIRTGDGAEIAF